MSGLSQSERNLQPKPMGETGQRRKRLYMKRDEIDQRADSRCPPGAGGRHKGSLDFAKLEPAIRGTPVVESQPRAGFLRRYPEPTSAITLNNLEIYETNTSD